MSEEICPCCGVDLRDKEIPREYLEKGWYGEWKPEDGPRYYNRTVAVEIPGVYDGALFYVCPVCRGRWHRWTDPEMRAKAEPYVNGNRAI